MALSARFDLVLIRDQLPAARATAYLNTGTAGPIPLAAARAMAATAEAEVASGRIGSASFQALMDATDRLRQALARLVGAREEEIALTHNTTEGLNVAIWGLNWHPGEVVVTTTLEHGGALLPLYQLQRRHGVQVEFADIGCGEPEETLAAMERSIRPGTRLVVVSHVTYGTGAVLPVAEIAEMAHRAGSLLLVDGAQSVGAIPVDVHALGADFYAFPGQKWLLGPEGTGGLFVHRERLAALEQTFVGFFGVDHEAYRPNDATTLSPAPGARRYEVGSVYRPAIQGLLASLTWLEEEVGVAAALAAIDRLARHCRERAAFLPGAEVLTPAGAAAGLVALRIPGLDPAGCVERLQEAGVQIRWIPDNGALRISCGFFNTPEEIDRALNLIREIAVA